MEEAVRRMTHAQAASPCFLLTEYGECKRAEEALLKAAVHLPPALRGLLLAAARRVERLRVRGVIVYGEDLLDGLERCECGAYYYDPCDMPLESEVSRCPGCQGRSRARASQALYLMPLVSH